MKLKTLYPITAMLMVGFLAGCQKDQKCLFWKVQLPYLPQ
jgi:hypothetical protein